MASKIEVPSSIQTPNQRLGSKLQHKSVAPRSDHRIVLLRFGRNSTETDQMEVISTGIYSLNTTQLYRELQSNLQLLVTFDKAQRFRLHHCWITSALCLLRDEVDRWFVRISDLRLPITRVDELCR